MVSAIRNQQAEKFKAKYKSVDALIIDDVQFLAGREKTQEEFFHIFNVLYEKNKQIIISSDRPPKAISELTERLRSRFEGGMIADISCPDFESTDTASNDFARPQSDSPCVNAALATLGVKYDYNGDLRDSSPDIGAVEYGGGATTQFTTSGTVSSGSGG